MNRPIVRILALGVLLNVVSCQRETTRQTASPSSGGNDGVLLRVGSLSVTQADLDHHLGGNPGMSREAALASLAERASLTQAALDEGLQNDPVARDEISRILSSRLRETRLDPQLRSIANEAIPESRLREIYESRKDQFQSAEKRQVAMLWLNPGGNPERAAEYRAKLTQARDWFLADEALKGSPDQGFSVLSVDHSEHASSRFKQGIIGWLEPQGGSDPLVTAAASIAFKLEKPGDISEVVSVPEGLFVVRLMAVKAAATRPFEAVAAELEQFERRRMIQDAEAAFLSSVLSRYPSSPLDGQLNQSRVSTTP